MVIPGRRSRSTGSMPCAARAVMAITGALPAMPARLGDAGADIPAQIGFVEDDGRIYTARVRQSQVSLNTAQVEILV